MLLLVRHGQSEANAAGLLIGRADSPLTQLGRLQADALGRAIARRFPSAPRLLTSPLQRAVETAESIAAAYSASYEATGRRRAADDAVAKLEVDERFIELDYGELDQRAISDLPAGLWDTWRADAAWRPTGGETLGEVKARVSAACEEIAASAAGGDVVVVSHVSPIKAAVAWALGTPADLAWRLSLSVASITKIALDGRPALVSFNETDHLEDVKAQLPGHNATVPRVHRL